MNPRILSCFISAPASSNLDNLRRSLSRRGIRIVAPSEFTGGAGFNDEIKRILSEVDLAIGVIARERRSDWTLFEMGVAFANAKQVLLFVPRSVSLNLPLDLRGVLTVRSSLRNTEAVEFALDQLIAAPARGPHPEAKRAPQFVTPGKLDPVILEMKEAIQSRQGSRLEEIVARALRVSGVEAMSSETRGDRRVDLAVWADGLQPSVGNPLLIEIKARVSEKKHARDAALQLSSYLKESATRWGLLLYGDGPSAREIQSVLPPNVLAISVLELFERMSRESFAEIVNDLRNRRVHGVSE